jgi:uncharacterized protein (TIGR03067 family)
MARITFALAALAAGLALADLKEEVAALSGTWSLVSTEANGDKPPEEIIDSFKMIITADRLTIKVKGRAVASSYKLYFDKKPKGIDLTTLDGPQKGAVKSGIYEVAGDELKLCISKEGRPRPKEFSGKKGSEQVIFVLKRETKK